MWSAGLDESQVGIKIAGRNINNLRYADDIVLIPENEEKLKSHLRRVKEESGKAGLKFNTQKAKIMACSPIISRQMEKEDPAADFIFLASKITAGHNYSHGVKRSLLLGRKAMTKLDSILKSRDIILLAKVHMVKAMIFPVVMYRCKSWTIKKAEHWRSDALEFRCWKKS